MTWTLHVKGSRDSIPGRCTCCGGQGRQRLSTPQFGRYVRFSDGCPNCMRDNSTGRATTAREVVEMKGFQLGTSMRVASVALANAMRREVDQAIMDLLHP